MSKNRRVLFPELIRKTDSKTVLRQPGKRDISPRILLTKGLPEKPHPRNAIQMARLLDGACKSLLERELRRYGVGLEIHEKDTNSNDSEVTLEYGQAYDKIPISTTWLYLTVTNRSGNLANLTARSHIYLTRLSYRLILNPTYNPNTDVVGEEEVGGAIDGKLNDLQSVFAQRNIKLTRKNISKDRDVLVPHPLAMHSSNLQVELHNAGFYSVATYEGDPGFGSVSIVVDREIGKVAQLLVSDSLGKRILSLEFPSD